MYLQNACHNRKQIQVMASECSSDKNEDKFRTSPVSVGCVISGLVVYVSALQEHILSFKAVSLIWDLRAGLSSKSHSQQERSLLHLLCDCKHKTPFQLA